jgi:hypothetical protein
MSYKAEKMPTGNFDSSLLTQRKRDLAVYTAMKARQAAVDATTGQTSIRPVQGASPGFSSGPSQEIYTQAKQTSGNTNPTDACACSAPVLSIPGGGTIYTGYVQ